MSKERTQFKPGQSGNPQGGKLHNADIRKLKSLGREQVAELGRLVLTNNYDDIVSVTKDENSSVLKLWMARVVLKGVSDGDVYILNTFLPWIVGKVPDKIETTNVHLIEEANRIRGLSKEQALIEFEETIKLVKAEVVVTEGKSK
jgi:hypothetical protein